MSTLQTVRNSAAWMAIGLGSIGFGPGCREQGSQQPDSTSHCSVVTHPPLRSAVEGIEAEYNRHFDVNADMERALDKMFRGTRGMNLIGDGSSSVRAYTDGLTEFTVALHSQIGIENVARPLLDALSTASQFETVLQEREGNPDAEKSVEAIRIAFRQSYNWTEAMKLPYTQAVLAAQDGDAKSAELALTTFRDALSNRYREIGIMPIHEGLLDSMNAALQMARTSR